MREEHISRGHPRPYFKGLVPQRSPNFGVPFYLCVYRSVKVTNRFQRIRGSTRMRYINLLLLTYLQVPGIKAWRFISWTDIMKAIKGGSVHPPSYLTFLLNVLYFSLGAHSLNSYFVIFSISCLFVVMVWLSGWKDCSQQWFIMCDGYFKSYLLSPRHEKLNSCIPA